ncbi:mariner Mos1 transposase [Trichonephila clavipes]|nr:mariner Mos1 transposase [Trichonephila clavipes]
MATRSWDRHGVLLVEFMQQRTTINAAAHCATLTKLRRAIQNKRRGLLTSEVLLLHDNARPHSAINTQNLIRSFGWEQIDPPPYSPNLAPSDFHLFRYLKEFLGGKRFDTADEVKEEVQDWLSSQAADVYDLGIQKLVERYDKCLNKYGNFTEVNGEEKPLCVTCSKILVTDTIEIVETMFGDNFAKELQSIPLSNDTVSRRIDDIAEDVEQQLFGKLREKLFSIQLDEATDSNKDAHFIAYVRFWDGMSAVEELLF